MTKNIKIDDNQIKSTIDKFYSQIKDYKEDGENTRYKSWEWCHAAFIKNKNDRTEENIEFLALHLAFYLASWGMYRGSSFLLQRDYKAHKAVVREILNKRYNILWNFNPKSNKNINEASELLFGQNGIYWNIRDSYGRNRPTETLITKILLGTYACIPAFDRYFKEGIANYVKNNGAKIGENKISKNAVKQQKAKEETETFRALCELAMLHKDAFTVESSYKYPLMKCVDMYFWQIGYDLKIENDKDKLQ